MVYIPECSMKAYSTALIIISLTPLFCHSRSNKCSSSFSVMWCCRPAGFTVGITDSWSLRFTASSLRKKDLQEGEQQSYFSYFNQSFHRFFWSSQGTKLTAGLVERSFVYCGCLLLCCPVFDSWSFR